MTRFLGTLRRVASADGAPPATSEGDVLVLSVLPGRNNHERALALLRKAHGPDFARKPYEEQLHLASDLIEQHRGRIA
jgi:hypothetical protein